MVMSEAVLLVILTPIAGAVATLLLKGWDAIAGRRKNKLEEGLTFRDELRKELDRKNNDLIAAKQEIATLKEAKGKKDQAASAWQRDYFELYAMFYPLRLLINTLPAGDSDLANAAIGQAPHERRALDSMPGV